MREIAWKANLGSLKGRSGIDMGEEILFFFIRRHFFCSIKVSLLRGFYSSSQLR